MYACGLDFIHIIHIIIIILIHNWIQFIIARIPYLGWNWAFWTAKVKGEKRKVDKTSITEKELNQLDVLKLGKKNRRKTPESRSQKVEKKVERELTHGFADVYFTFVCCFSSRLQWKLIQILQITGLLFSHNPFHNIYTLS